MGALYGEDDVQIPALFASMNERFAPMGKKGYIPKSGPEPDSSLSRHGYWLTVLRK